MEAQSLFNLDGAVAIVTGGGTGIGLMAAIALASNGAKVYITGRRENVLHDAVEAHGKNLRGSLVPIQADVSNKDDLKKVADSITEKKVHVLVNNAGIVGPQTELKPDPSQMSADAISKAHLASEEFADWDKLFRTNTASIFFATMALLPLLAAGTASPPASRASKSSYDSAFSASVINITSISGIVKLSQGHYAYNASKAASNSLTMMLAHELNFSSKLNVRVNSIAPGLFPSEMTSGGKSEKGKTDPSMLGEFTNPAGRTGDYAEMGSAILFLATNTFVNGQILAVDGGFVTAVPSSR